LHLEEASLQFIRRRAGGAPRQLTEAEIREIAALVASELGPDLVPDPQSLLDPSEAAEVNLEELTGLLVKAHHKQWPAIAHAYYLETGDMIRRGAMLQRQAIDLVAATPYLDVVWQQAGSSILAAAPGPLPSTSLGLVLNDPGPPWTIRGLTSRRLAEMGCDPQAALNAIGERVVATGVDPTPVEGSHRLSRIDLDRGLGGILVLSLLDDLCPEMVGPLGTLAFLPTPGTLFVRPIGFDDGLRDDMRALLAWAIEEAPAGRQPPVGPFWRRHDGRLFAIDMEVSRTSDHPQVILNDERFLGVMMASEPRTLLEVPRWAQPHLDDDGWTRFIGVLASSLREPVIPEILAGVIAPDDSDVVLARRCALVDREVWPRLMLLTRRLAVRWERFPPPPALDPGGSHTRWTATDVRDKAGPLVDHLAAQLRAMPDIVAAALEYEIAIRAGDGPNAVEWKGIRGTPEEDLVVVVALAPGADLERLIDQLFVAMAKDLPRGASPGGMYGIIELTLAQDPRFQDSEHFVQLKDGALPQADDTEPGDPVAH
jgi:hypothetical protein